MTPEEINPENPLVAPAATAWTAVVNKAIAVADDSPELKDTGSSLARSGRTIARALEVCLLPLAAVNFAYEKARIYFNEKFPEKIAKHTDHIPPENLQDPKPMVAAEALKGLSFSHDEPSLEDMYLKLLATAMDSRKQADAAHPAFVEVIRQLTSDEATLLKNVFLSKTSLPVARLHHILPAVDNTPQGHFVICRYIFGLFDDGNPTEVSGLGAMIDNWIRLGLVSVSFTEFFTDSTAYDFTEFQPETIRARAQIGDNGSVNIVRGSFSITDFGKRFAASVGITVG